MIIFGLSIPLIEPSITPSFHKVVESKRPHRFDSAPLWKDGVMLCSIKGILQNCGGEFSEENLYTVHALTALTLHYSTHTNTHTHTHTESTEKLFGLLRGCIFRVMKSHDQTKAACLPRFFALGTVLPPTLTRSLKVKLL